MSLRKRSYCVSKKNERKTSSGEEGSAENKNLKCTNAGAVEQSSNESTAAMNDSKTREMYFSGSLLVTNKLEQEKPGKEATVLFSETTSKVHQEDKVKEQGNSSDDSDTDYDGRLSDEEPEEVGLGKHLESSQDTTPEAPVEPCLQPQNEKEKQEEPSRLTGNENEEPDTSGSHSEHTYKVSSAKVKLSLDVLDQLEEGNTYTEREIYEKQLLQLQHQLVATMIQEQEKSEKLNKLENLKLEAVLQELEEEKAKTSELTEKLLFMKNKAKNSSLRRSNAGRRIKGRPRSFVVSDDNQKERPTGEERGRINDDGGSHHQRSDDALLLQNDDIVFNFDEGHFALEPGSASDKTEAPPRFAKLQEYKTMVKETIVDRLCDFVNEEQETSHKKDDDGDALSVITLKENINRCKTGAKPITHVVEPVIDILTWTSPVASFMTFLVYMFAVINGFLLPIVILLFIWQLSLNYFYASGLAAKFGLVCKEEPPPPDDKKLSDRFQLVLQVAKKVQNTLGEVADSLEKIKNLLTWQHPVTKQLFIVLCIAFAVSSLLDGSTLFMIAGLGIGVKLFIIRPIYSKFPKVKKRYDSLARIWSELPTDANLAKQKKREFYFKNDEDDLPSSLRSPKLESPDFVTKWTNWCARMKIPFTELPVPSWEEGHRCTLMTKDKPLANMKHGKLFLTQGYLCFERYKLGSSKNVVIKLEEIAQIDKYQPMNVMPGTGMSIKIEIRGSNKPYIFGALLMRDVLYESLIATCKAAKIPWACEGKY